MDRAPDGKLISTSRLKVVAVLGAAALVLLTVALLVNLRPLERRTGGDPEPGRAAPLPPAPPRAPPPRASAVIPAPARPVSPAPASPRDPTLPKIVHPRADTRTHSAPPAIRSEITSVTDPVKKARLMRMHLVATTRVRAAQLKRRAQLLSDSIARAIVERSWSPARVAREEETLKEIQAAIKKAETNLRTVLQAVGDADRQP